jgi:hypothetical protein
MLSYFLQLGIIPTEELSIFIKQVIMASWQKLTDKKATTAINDDGLFNQLAERACCISR